MEVDWDTKDSFVYVHVVDTFKIQRWDRKGTSATNKSVIWVKLAHPPEPRLSHLEKDSTMNLSSSFCSNILQFGSI